MVNRMLDRIDPNVAGSVIAISGDKIIYCLNLSGPRN